MDSKDFNVAQEFYSSNAQNMITDGIKHFVLHIIHNVQVAYARKIQARILHLKSVFLGEHWVLGRKKSIKQNRKAIFQ